MKPVELPAAFRKLLRQLNKQERRKIGLALSEVEQAYGQPHRHRGLGLRGLPKGCVEVRVGLDQRIVLRVTRDALVCEMIGTHDEVKKFLGNL